MIFKIVGDFEKHELDKILEKLKDNFYLLYKTGVLYIALRNWDKKDSARVLMKSVFKPQKDFYIIEINEKNILNEPQETGEWCKNNFVSLERQRFEIEQQAKLLEVWTAMDQMENSLKEILEKNKRGETE